MTRKLIALGLAGGALVVAGTATAAQSPSVSTGRATHVKELSAVLTGTVRPNGADTTYQFEWGLTTAYGTITGTRSAGHGTAPVGVKVAARHLFPGIKYHYRLIADSRFGQTAGTRPDVHHGGPSGGGRGHRGGGQPEHFGDHAHRDRQPEPRHDALVLQLRADDRLRAAHADRDAVLADPGHGHRAAAPGPRLGHDLPLPAGGGEPQPAVAGDGRDLHDLPEPGAGAPGPQVHDAAPRRAGRRSRSRSPGTSPARRRSRRSSRAAGPRRSACSSTTTASGTRSPRSAPIASSAARSRSAASPVAALAIAVSASGCSSTTAATATSRPRGRRSGTSRWADRGPVAQPVHEAQPRPRLVHRAHLVVHEPGRQAELADDALGDVGVDAGRPLRPGDPQPAGGSRARRATVAARAPARGGAGGTPRSHRTGPGAGASPRRRPAARPASSRIPPEPPAVRAARPA